MTIQNQQAVSEDKTYVKEQCTFEKGRGKKVKFIMHFENGWDFFSD
jgi:hypothetical protein